MAVFIITAAYAAMPGQSFQYYSSVATNTTDSSGFFLLDLDPKVFAALDPSLRDLRIFNRDGSETGYIRFNESASDTPPPNREVQIINKGPILGTDRYSFALKDVPTGTSMISIKLAGSEYLVKASITGSNDNRNWQDLGRQTLYCINGTYNTFTLPKVDYQYLKFTYQVPQDDLLEVTGAEVSALRQQPTVSHEQSYPVAQQDQNKATIITIDLRYQNQPSSGFSLSTDEKNFYRRGYLEASNDGRQWAHIADFYLFRGDGPNDQSLGQDYPLTQARYLRITIDNKDNPPIHFTEAVVGTEPIQLLVKAPASQGPFTLCWGDKKLDFPDYDVEEVLRQGDAALDKLPVFPVKEYQRNPQYKGVQEPLSERFPWLLPVALAVAVAVVGFVQYRSIKRIEK